MKPQRRSLSARKLARLDSLLAEEGLAPAAAGISRRPPGAATPLLIGEEQLWFLARLAPEDPAYNMPFVLHLIRLDDHKLFDLRRALAAALAELTRTA